MLPFLEPKKISSIIIARRGKPDVEAHPEVDMTTDDERIDPGLKEVATDLLHAIESKSVVELAQALKAAHEICESYADEDSESSQHLNSTED